MTDPGDHHDHDDRRTDWSGQHVDRTELIERISTGLSTPPVGLVLIELLVDIESDGRSVEPDLIDRVIDQRLRGDMLGDDIVLATGDRRLALIRTAMGAPAEAEGLAYRLHRRLSAPIVIDDEAASCQVAIGVAVSRSGDRGSELLRYAEHALGDARMLGADTVVAFDDQDRDLLLP